MVEKLLNLGYNMIADKLIALHETNGYFIGAQPVDGGFLMEYPENVLVSPPLNFEMVFYQFHNDGISKAQSRETSEDPQIIKCPKYAQNAAVILDVVLTCTKRGISSSLIIAANAEGERVPAGTDISELLPELEDSEDSQKEKAIFTALKGILEGRDCQQLIESSNIEEGYVFLQTIFRIGGL